MLIHNQQRNSFKHGFVISSCRTQIFMEPEKRWFGPCNVDALNFQKLNIAAVLQNLQAIASVFLLDLECFE